MTTDYELLREQLNYEPDTGVFTWLVRPANCIHVGDVAGTPNGDGHIQIRFRGKKQYAHRLAWLYMLGYWPDMQIDHISIVPNDNRWDNLRLATPGQNSHNQTNAHSTNKVGLLGTHYFPSMRKYRAEITVNKVKHRLGFYDTAEQAHAAYVSAKRELHPFWKGY